MSNLLKETKEILKMHGKTVKDVQLIGNVVNGVMSWKTFAKLANKEYNSGCGGNEVCSDVVCLDLVITGDDWWLERCEYGGGEWWEFKTMPVLPLKKAKKCKELIWE